MRIYERVGAVVKDFATERLREDRGTIDAQLRDALACTPSGAIDYARFGDTFIRMYLEDNYWKTVGVLRRLGNVPADRVVDLGCGPGASAAAVLAHVLARGQRTRATPRLLLVDRAPGQLLLAAELIERIGTAIGLEAVVRTQVFDCDRPDGWHWGRHDLTVAAHLCTENPGHVREVLDTVGAVTDPSGAIVIVERPDDPVWRCCTEFFAATGDTWVTDRGRMRVDDTSRTRAAGWAIRPPAGQRWQAELVDRYLCAWREQSVELLDDVFAEDASYAEKPFRRVMSGLAEIRDYWRRDVLSQENPVIRVLGVVHTTSSAVLQWQAEFTRRGVDHELCGFMELEFDPRRRRVRHLQEVFRTEKTPRSG